MKLGIIHLVRNALRAVSWKDKKAVSRDINKVYSSVTVSEAEMELEQFAE